MKTYRSIQGPEVTNKTAWVFLKYDGSNMRFEWSPKKGWHKFGTRKRVINESENIYGEGVNIFLNKYADDFEKAFTKLPKTDILLYGEFFGAKSLGGQHKPDDPKDVVIFDCNIHKKGLMSPFEFEDNFNDLHIAECLGVHTIHDKFINEIKNGDLKVESKYDIRAEVPEGVICKSGSGHNIWMCKVKTDKYKEALKKEYESDWVKYWE